MERWNDMQLALGELERELQALGLWSAVPPPAAALASQQPFCIDTLDFHLWLQWVFVPRLRALRNRNGSLPAGCNILPIGEEAFAPLGRRSHGLLAVLGRIDQLANQLN